MLGWGALAGVARIPEGPPRMSNQPEPSRPVVLLVIASLQLRSAIRQCLQSVRPDGMYLEAASGEEALGICQAHEAALVLLDMRLPGMSAHDTTRRIKAMTPATQIVVLAEPYEIAWLRLDAEKGVSGSICKDFLYEELDLMLPTYLGRASAKAARGDRGAEPRPAADR